MTSEEYLLAADQAIAQAKQLQERYHCFTVLDEKHVRAQAQRVASILKQEGDQPLAGVFLSVKDNICVTGLECRAGSAILSGYRPVYEATVVSRLRKQGAVVIGMTAMDEFGFGSWSTNVGKGFAIPKHPRNPEKVVGGSSGGAAVVTATAPFSHLALAESTGGSIETPASVCGVFGYCPTYGLLSRHGVISYADSLDKLGFMSSNVKGIRAGLDASVGVDPRDATSIPPSIRPSKSGPLRIGILDCSHAEPSIKEAFSTFVNSLQDHSCVSVTLPFTSEFALAAYYVLAMCEASTNLAMFSGLRYGAQQDPQGSSFRELFTRIRSENFGDEAKKRVLLGTAMRAEGYADAYYHRAVRAQKLIAEEYAKIFSEVDVLLSPTLPCPVPAKSDVLLQDSVKTYQTDLFTVGPNVAGVPHGSIPAGTVDDMPFGVLACTAHLDDYTLLDFMTYCEGLR